MTSSTMTSPSALRSLYHCSPRSEKMMRAVDEFITLMTKVCRPSQSSSVGHRTRRPVGKHFDSLISNVRENPRRDKMGKSGFFWNDKESRFSLIFKQRFEKHEFQADYDRRSIQKLNEMIESQRGVNSSCSSRRRTTSKRSSASS